MAGQNWRVQYNPISFDDMIKIPTMVVEEHDKQEEMISTMLEEASKWEKLKESAIDKESYEQYQSYENKLKQQADNLARYGINANSKKDIYKLKGEYNKTIQPLSDAYDYRQKMIEEQRQHNKDGRYMYDIDFSNVSLQDIIKNPSMTYSSIDLEDARTQGKLAGEQASKSHVIDPTYQLVMGNYYYAMTQQYGYTPEEAATELTKQNSTLSTYVDNIMKSYNTDGFSEQQKKALRDRITVGMIEGVSYGEKVDLRENKGKLNAYESAVLANQKSREDTAKKMYEPRTIYIYPNGNKVVQTYNPNGSGSIIQVTDKDGKVLSTNSFNPSNQRLNLVDDGIVVENLDTFTTSSSPSADQGSSNAIITDNPKPATARQEKQNIGTLYGESQTDSGNGLQYDSDDDEKYSVSSIVNSNKYNGDGTYGSGAYKTKVYTLADLQQEKPSLYANIREYIRKTVVGGSQKINFPRNTDGTWDTNNIIVFVDEDPLSHNHYRIEAKPSVKQVIDNIDQVLQDGRTNRDQKKVGVQQEEDLNKVPVIVGQ